MRLSRVVTLWDNLLWNVQQHAFLVSSSSLHDILDAKSPCQTGCLLLLKCFRSINKTPLVSERRYFASPLENLKNVWNEVQNNDTPKWQCIAKPILLHCPLESFAFGMGRTEHSGTATPQTLLQGGQRHPWIYLPVHSLLFFQNNSCPGEFLSTCVITYCTGAWSCGKSSLDNLFIVSMHKQVSETRKHHSLETFTTGLINEAKRQWENPTIESFPRSGTCKTVVQVFPDISTLVAGILIFERKPDAVNIMPRWSGGDRMSHKDAIFYQYLEILSTPIILKDPLSCKTRW